MELNEIDMAADPPDRYVVSRVLLVEADRNGGPWQHIVYGKEPGFGFLRVELDAGQLPKVVYAGDEVLVWGSGLEPRGLAVTGHVVHYATRAADEERQVWQHAGSAIDEMDKVEKLLLGPYGLTPEGREAAWNAYFDLERYLRELREALERTRPEGARR